MPDHDFGAGLKRYLGGPLGMSHRSIRFLARGEYSLNYLVRGEPDLVARLVTGTQMGLPLEEQAPYEYHALELLAPSGVTPKPYHVDPNPDGLPYPLILEEYLPGRPLDYSTDLPTAARCLAAVHALGVPERHHLRAHPVPAPAILEESRGLAEPYLSWDGASEGSKTALMAATRAVGSDGEGNPVREPASDGDKGEPAGRRASGGGGPTNRANTAPGCPSSRNFVRRHNVQGPICPFTVPDVGYVATKR